MVPTLLWTARCARCRLDGASRLCSRRQSHIGSGPWFVVYSIRYLDLAGQRCRVRMIYILSQSQRNNGRGSSVLTKRVVRKIENNAIMIFVEAISLLGIPFRINIADRVSPNIIIEVPLFKFCSNKWSSTLHDEPSGRVFFGKLCTASGRSAKTLLWEV